MKCPQYNEIHWANRDYNSIKNNNKKRTFSVYKLKHLNKEYNIIN